MSPQPTSRQLKLDSFIQFKVRPLVCETCAYLSRRPAPWPNTRRPTSSSDFQLASNCLDWHHRRCITMLGFRFKAGALSGRLESNSTNKPRERPLNWSLGAPAHFLRQAPLITLALEWAHGCNGRANCLQRKGGSRKRTRNEKRETRN